jgi:uracil-DNA glycosylase
MIQDWNELNFWKVGEYDVIRDNLKEFQKQGIQICPTKNPYRALKLTPPPLCKVLIVGQDPYPNPLHATGVAFSIPENIGVFPPTLMNIHREYVNDLGYPLPSNGNLERWCSEGVLLWNAVPTCNAGQPASHSQWPEYRLLTEEIVRVLGEKGIVFVFLGNSAQSYATGVPDDDRNAVIRLSHPSPRASFRARNPFLGSRIFTTINLELDRIGHDPVDWRLP